jgi:hypothetical protein
LYSLSVSAYQSTPASEFSAESSDILQIVETNVSQSMMNHLLMLQNVNRGARKRFITLQDVVGYEWNGSAGNVPLQVDGAFDATTTTLSSQGTFFGQAGLGDGARRLVFGDFDIQHDSETGSSTATMNGQIAWEQSVSDKTMLGYFIGGELAHSNIAGSFDGDQNRIGVNAGGYAVREIAQQVYVDGFFSLGAGRNNLAMSNGVLDLESDYTTRTAALGAALSGVIEQQGFDILPELSLSYGRTWIGNVGFTGAAHSLVDNNLSLDAGTVTLANILFRPEPADRHLRTAAELRAGQDQRNRRKLRRGCRSWLLGPLAGWAELGFRQDHGRPAGGSHHLFSAAEPAASVLITLRDNVQGAAFGPPFVNAGASCHDREAQ